MVPVVDVGVMKFMALGFKLIPLNTGMQNVQNVVKDFIERQLRLWPCLWSFQMGINISVKVFTRDFSWNPMINE